MRTPAPNPDGAALADHKREEPRAGLDVERAARDRIAELALRAGRSDFHARRRLLRWLANTTPRDDGFEELAKYFMGVLALLAKREELYLGLSARDRALRMQADALDALGLQSRGRGRLENDPESALSIVRMRQVSGELKKDSADRIVRKIKKRTRNID